MHVQIVTFRLEGIDDTAFRAMCEELAPAFTDVPGMHAKIWLADPATNTYGGVYTWRDRAAMEEYARSDLFRSVLSHPNFTAITSRDFAALAGPTKVTRGLQLERVSA